MTRFCFIPPLVEHDIEPSDTEVQSQVRATAFRTRRGLRRQASGRHRRHEHLSAEDTPHCDARVNGSVIRQSGSRRRAFRISSTSPDERIQKLSLELRRWTSPSLASLVLSCVCGCGILFCGKRAPPTRDSPMTTSSVPRPLARSFRRTCGRSFRTFRRSTPRSTWNLGPGIFDARRS